MIGRLGCGEMRLRVGEKTQRYYLDGGFVQVRQNEVAVLTEQAIPADQIDEAAARKVLDDLGFDVPGLFLYERGWLMSRGAP